MDKVTHYREVVIGILSEIAEWMNRVNDDTIETQTIFDHVNNRYMVLDAGWTASKRVRSIIVYVRIVNGKIWIDEDWTEEGVGTHFLEADIPKHDIVLGFKHPELRPFTEFAVA